MRNIHFRTISFPLLAFLVFSLLSSCGSIRKASLKREVKEVLANKGSQSHFTGLLVIEAGSGDTLFALNEKKYFTPASNMKILTLFAALKYLPPHMPSLEYQEVEGTLYFRGLGDPTQMHPYFRDSTVINFLSSYDSLVYLDDHYKDTPLGPGWAWEDFDAGFAAERSPLPLYGNVLSVYPGRMSRVQPSLFNTKVNNGSQEFRRAFEDNRFFIPVGRRDTLQIPFRTHPDLTIALLQEALDGSLSSGEKMPEGKTQTLFSIDRDSILSRMMVESDNFLAEQLLLGVSWQLQRSLDTKETIRSLLREDLNFLPQEPRWVDGSGLSRYNLITPSSLVSVLSQLYQEISMDKLKSYFPAGGRSGTLKDWYDGGTSPYVYAKSGTLSNNYSLSGYLVSRKGKILVFSLMHNHFRQPQAVIKQDTERILQILRDTY